MAHLATREGVLENLRCTPHKRRVWLHTARFFAVKVKKDQQVRGRLILFEKSDAIATAQSAVP